MVSKTFAEKRISWNEAFAKGSGNVLNGYLKCIANRKKEFQKSIILICNYICI